MCGIAGIIGDPAGGEIIPSMLDAMNHRGPDARGRFSSDPVHLGHCRLSINDLSPNANQPFIDASRKVAVIVNGEIYNFRAIRAELESRGFVFRSASDCEILLHGYLEHGLDIIPRLNGMFAGAIWDGRNHALFLFRDRLGIKPLYYASRPGLFLFASEIKALACHPALSLDIDPQSLMEYLVFENYFADRTLNRSIKMVEPGAIVRIDPNALTVARSRYWEPDFRHDPALEGEAVYDVYRQTLEKAVERHLISDVPLGSYLSSGIDSSSVAYCASRTLGRGIRTYTGFFGVSGFYDESGPAARLAETFGCKHHRVEIRPRDFMDQLETIGWHLDEPRVGPGSFSQYMVAREASRELKVILTGHGGDEFFAGYPVFKAIYGKRNLSRLFLTSSPRERMFAAYFLVTPLLRSEARYFLPVVFSLRSLRKMLAPEWRDRIKPGMFAELDNLKAGTPDDYQRLVKTYLKLYLPALFTVEDKISMAFSLESRTPLCDNELLDLALSIPLSAKLKGLELKHIPRTAMKGRLPDELYRLPKKGFPTPIPIWFKHELSGFVREYIMDHRALLDMFRPEALEPVIRRVRRLPFDSPADEIPAHRIWILLNLIVYRKHQRRRYRKE